MFLFALLSPCRRSLIFSRRWPSRGRVVLSFAFASFASVSSAFGESLLRPQSTKQKARNAILHAAFGQQLTARRRKSIFQKEKKRKIPPPRENETNDMSANFCRISVDVMFIRCTIQPSHVHVYTHTHTHTACTHNTATNYYYYYYSTLLLLLLL